MLCRMVGCWLLASQLAWAGPSDDLSAPSTSVLASRVRAHSMTWPASGTLHFSVDSSLLAQAEAAAEAAAETNPDALIGLAMLRGIRSEGTLDFATQVVEVETSSNVAATDPVRAMAIEQVRRGILDMVRGAVLVLGVHTGKLVGTEAAVSVEDGRLRAVTEADIMHFDPETYRPVRIEGQLAGQAIVQTITEWDERGGGLIRRVESTIDGQPFGVFAFDWEPVGRTWFVSRMQVDAGGQVITVTFDDLRVE